MKKKIEYILKKKNQQNLVLLLKNNYLTKIYCDGLFIYEIEGTQKFLHTEIWAQNHPFFIEYYNNTKVSAVENFNKFKNICLDI